MLRLSKKADYALLALSYMATPGRPPIATAREMAEHHAIPVELLAKVLQRLVRAGVLTSLQGLRGGYRLAQPPRDISVARVVAAIDGPLALTACDDRPETCGQYVRCSIRDPLHRIRERMVAALDACSVAELAPAEPGDEGRPVPVAVITQARGRV